MRKWLCKCLSFHIFFCEQVARKANSTISIKNDIYFASVLKRRDGLIQRSRVENGFCISKVIYQSSEYETHASRYWFCCMRNSCQNVKGYEINWRRFGAWDHGVKQISWKREKGRWFLFLFSYSIFLLDYCYKFCLSLCERLDYFYAGS